MTLSKETQTLCAIEKQFWYSYMGFRQSSIGKKMAAVHFVTVPCEPSGIYPSKILDTIKADTAHKAQESHILQYLSPVALGIMGNCIW